MCDYCDCRSHPQIAALSAEHEQLLSSLVRLEVAADRDDQVAAESAIAILADLLDQHARREEHGIVVELRRAEIADDDLDEVERDHEAIHRLIAGCGRPGWRVAASALADRLRHHIAREESDLFPAAHQLLSPAQWDAVDRRAVDHHAAS